jgi:hypothetical protein
MIDPVFPLGVSIAGAVVALGILLFLEFRRKQKYLILRIIAQVFIVLSVFLMIMRPSIKTAATESILLLTEGYNQKTVDSLPSLKPVAFNSYNELSKLSGVKVIAGNGLPSWALDLLPSQKYSFITSAQPEGITAIEADQHIYAHRWNSIRGRYYGNESLIKLRGPAGIEDSVKISGKEGIFSLSFFAKAPGRFNYELITPEGSETLPLIIEPERILNIIFVSDYPTFELRYLKNFLASKGHRLSVRNRVSKGKYKFEFSNRPSSNFQSITTTLLNGADLMVIDENSWNALNTAEQRNIHNSINDGLGVIIMPENGKSIIQFHATQQKDTVSISLGKAGAIRLPALTLEAKQANPILTSKSPAGDRVVSGYVYSRSGKIGYQLLMETYQAGLQGKTEMYSGLWVPLLEKCARTKKEEFRLRITSPFPYYENEPISFDIISSGKQPLLKVDNISLPLTEDVYIDDLWHGAVWLEGNSWHDFTVDSTKTSVHVSKDGTWRSVRESNNQKATAKHSESANESSSVAYSKNDNLPKIILFLIFILASGLLWLAPKL